MLRTTRRCCRIRRHLTVQESLVEQERGAQLRLRQHAASRLAPRPGPARTPRAGRTLPDSRVRCRRPVPGSPCRRPGRAARPVACLIAVRRITGGRIAAGGIAGGRRPAYRSRSRIEITHATSCGDSARSSRRMARRQRHRAAAEQALRMPDVEQLDDRAGRELAVDALDAGQEQRAAGAQAVLGVAVHVHRALGVGDAADPAPGRLELSARRRGRRCPSGRADSGCGPPRRARGRSRWCTRRRSTRPWRPRSASSPCRRGRSRRP